MVADAESGLFEVLLCYDTSRFARNVGQANEYRDRLARAGVAIVFCSDGLISGNVDTFEIEGLKHVADAAYVRRLSCNVARGYEHKWRLFSDPGGRPPLGFARLGERKLLAPVDGPDLEKARRAFDLYAAGTWSDMSFADELGLTVAGVAEILTNPLNLAALSGTRDDRMRRKKPHHSKHQSIRPSSTESRRCAKNGGRAIRAARWSIAHIPSSG